MKTTISKWLALGLAGLLAAGEAWGVPKIQHSPVTAAQQGRALGLRASVTDTAARVKTVSLYYALSRGSTPFRVEMTSSGAGQWYGTIPGHLVGPGKELFYYIEAENADGETSETDWQTVRVLAAATTPAAIPSATAVATQRQATAVPKTDEVAQRGVGTAPSRAPKVDNSKKYWITAGIIAGGAVAVGGAIALSNSGGGGGGGSGGGGGGSGDGGAVTNGNFGGAWQVCFEPSATDGSGGGTDCRTGDANVYVKGGSVEIVGLWGSEILTGTASGNVFSAAKTVDANGTFPSANLSVSGSFSGGGTCSMSVSGSSTDALRPGVFAGSFSGSKR